MSHKDLKERILALIGLWRPVLDLENWVIRIDWTERKILAGCTAMPEYKNASLSFNLARIAKECSDPVDLEELVVHELTHIPLWLVARGLESRSRTKIVAYIEEHTATTISRALLRARREGELRGKRRG